MKKSFYSGYNAGFKDGIKHGEEVTLAIIAKMYLSNEYPEYLQMELGEFLTEKKRLWLLPGRVNNLSQNNFRR